VIFAECLLTAKELFWKEGLTLLATDPALLTHTVIEMSKADTA
jgi:hypothetical protein